MSISPITHLPTYDTGAAAADAAAMTHLSTYDTGAAAADAAHTSWLLIEELLSAVLLNKESTLTTWLIIIDALPTFKGDLGIVVRTAVMMGYDRCLLTLLTNQKVLAQVNTQAKGSKDTALMIAIHSDHMQSLQILLTKQEVVEGIALQNIYGNNAVMIAASKGRARHLEKLLSALNTPQQLDTTLKATDKTGKNALMQAAESRQTECLRLLLSHSNQQVKAHVLTTTEKFCGKSALQLAACEGNMECLKILLEAITLLPKDVQKRQITEAKEKTDFWAHMRIHEILREQLETLTWS